MAFQFVDNSVASTPDTRRTIRRHVMKGKNRGKKIPGRGRKHAPGTSSHEHDGKAPRRAETQLLFPEITNEDVYSIFTGTEFEYFAFPTQFTPEMRYTIHQYFTAINDTIYPHAFCRPSDSGKAPWVEYMADQAFLHCLLAMAATYINLFQKPGSETLEATRHFSQAIRLVNNQLSTSSVPTDQTLAVIVMFAIHGSLMGDVARMEMHLRGLEKALAVRPGGVLSLRQTNGDLTHKIYRTDLEYAIKAGTQTFFGPWRLVRTEPLSERRLVFPLNQTCLALRPIIKEVIEFCGRAEKNRLLGLEYQNVLTWVWQQLIDFAPLNGERPQNPLDDVVQLSLLAFLTTVNYSIEFLRTMHTALLRNMLRERIEKDALSALDRDYLPLRFWIAMVFGLLSQNLEECPITQLKVLTADIGLQSWRDVKSCLRPFPWIGLVHEKLGKQLWENRVQSHAPDDTQ